MLCCTWVPAFRRNVLPHYEGGDVHHRNEILIKFYQNVYMTQYDILTSNYVKLVYLVILYGITAEKCTVCIIYSSAQELVQLRVKVDRTLPTKGMKEFQPCNSWLEKKQIQTALEERKNHLEEERVERL